MNFYHVQQSYQWDCWSIQQDSLQILGKGGVKVEKRLSWMNRWSAMSVSHIILNSHPLFALHLGIWCRSHSSIGTPNFITTNHYLKGAYRWWKYKVVTWRTWSIRWKKVKSTTKIGMLPNSPFSCIQQKSLA